MLLNHWRMLWETKTSGGSYYGARFLEGPFWFIWVGIGLIKNFYWFKSYQSIFQFCTVLAKLARHNHGAFLLQDTSKFAEAPGGRNQKVLHMKNVGIPHPLTIPTTHEPPTSGSWPQAARATDGASLLHGPLWNAKREENSTRVRKKKQLLADFWSFLCFSGAKNNKFGGKAA